MKMASRSGGSLLTVGVLLVLACQSSVATINCRHRAPGPEEVIYHVHQRSSHVWKRHTEQQLRVKIQYDPSIDNLVPAKKRLVKNKLFPQAISYLQRTFQVRRPSSSILLSRQCANNQYLKKKSDPHRYCHGACAQHTRCGPVIVPEEHLQQCMLCSDTEKYCGPSGPPDSGGIRDTERCSQENIVAYAAYCQLEAEMDRPIAGYANLCPNMISTQSQEFAGMLSTVKHEIIHALLPAFVHQPSLWGGFEHPYPPPYLRPWCWDCRSMEKKKIEESEEIGMQERKVFMDILMRDMEERYDKMYNTDPGLLSFLCNLSSPMACYVCMLLLMYIVEWCIVRSIHNWGFSNGRSSTTEVTTSTSEDAVQPLGDNLIHMLQVVSQKDQQRSTVKDVHRDIAAPPKGPCEKYLRLRRRPMKASRRRRYK